MRCSAKNADKTPCENEATTRVLSNGYFVYVCAFHNSIMSKVVQAGRISSVPRPEKDYSKSIPVPGLGAWKPTDEILGVTIRSKRNGR